MHLIDPPDMRQQPLILRPQAITLRLPLLTFINLCLDLLEFAMNFFLDPLLLLNFLLHLFNYTRAVAPLAL